MAYLVEDLELNKINIVIFSGEIFMKQLFAKAGVHSLDSYIMVACFKPGVNFAIMKQLQKT